MKTKKYKPEDAANFLEAVLYYYPENDEGTNEMDGRSIYDFSPEFTAAVNQFCQSFRDFLASRLDEEQIEALDDSPRSFGGNVYLSLSGLGSGFGDSDDTEHLQPLLREFSGNDYRFEGIDLMDDRKGKLDLSFIPSALPEHRARMFTPAASIAASL